MYRQLQSILSRRAQISDQYRLATGSDPTDGGGQWTPPSLRPAEGEDLPFKVELWNEEKTGVEQLLAVTANSGIGYAAYYAATREFPHRYITLRHKQSIVSRWNGPSH